MDDVTVEIVKLIPSALWVIFAFVVLALFYRRICDDLLPKIGSFKAMGVEFSFVKNSIDAAIELAQKSPNWKVDVSALDKERALNRVKQHLAIIKNAQILWVDDHPENNLNERRMFRQLNAEIDIAKSTDEAGEILANGTYDLIISDMARSDKATAGLDLLAHVRMKNITTPVIFYVGTIDPNLGVPALAFGITNRPDELLHLTLDALEREKY
jgi:CheY-like chemotaxis protein